jgi:hypothetical protein
VHGVAVPFTSHWKSVELYQAKTIFLSQTGIFFYFSSSNYKHKTCIRWIQSVSQPHPFFCELNFGQTRKKEEAGECPISVIRSEQLSQKNNFFSYKKQWINCLPKVFFWGIKFR